jgi:Domain of unknown function (DUF4188)
VANVINFRISDEMEGKFVAFLIGMRINKLWKLHKWLPVFLAIPKMLKELEAHPEVGDGSVHRTEILPMDLARSGRRQTGQVDC